MKKLIKIIVLFTIILVFLIVGGGVALLTLVNPNTFKGQITGWVHNKTGRELVIDGDIERSFFPWLGLRAHKVRLSNAPGFEPNTTFISMDQVDVRVKLIPLLSRKIEVAKVILNDVELNLAKDAAGKTNWQDLLAQKPKKNIDSIAPSSTTSNNQVNNTPAEISVEELEINNAHISWVNAQNGDTVQLKNLNLKSKHMGFDSAFPFYLQFTLQGYKQTLRGQFTVDSDVTVGSRLQQFKLDKLRLTGLLPNVPKVSLTADTIGLNLNQQTLNCDNLTLTLGDLTARIALQGEKMSTQAVLKGNVQLLQFNLKELGKSMGKAIATRDPAALQRVSVKADFVATKNSLQLSGLQAQIDDSNIKGNFGLKNFTTQDLSFDLDLDQINLDRYMPIGAKANLNKRIAETTSAEPAGAVASVDMTVPVDSTRANFLRTALVDGALKVGSLTLSNTPFTHVLAQLTVKGGVVRIAPLKAEVFQGHMENQVGIDLRGAIPKFTVEETLTNVLLSQLFKSKRLTGVAHITSHVTAQGTSKSTILKNLNGTIVFNVQDGAFLGADIPYELERAIAVIKKQPLPTAPTVNQTDFSQFSGTGEFSNGVMTTNDLQIISSRFKITGKGTADLVSEQLNFRLLAEKNPPAAHAMAIPILVSGTLSKPVIVPDIQAISALLLKQQVREKIQQIQEKIRTNPGEIRENIRQRAAPLLQRVLQ